MLGLTDLSILGFGGVKDVTQDSVVLGACNVAAAAQPNVLEYPPTDVDTETLAKVATSRSAMALVISAEMRSFLLHQKWPMLGRVGLGKIAGILPKSKVPTLCAFVGLAKLS